MHPSLYDLTFSDLEGEIAAAGLRKVHARTLWRAMHRHIDEPLATETFQPPLRRWMATHAAGGSTLNPEKPALLHDVRSSDGLTRKFLLRLADGQTVETVTMGYARRHTVCLSTQAGCAMGCIFCATGQMGFVRHLRPGEIVAQALIAQRILRADAASSVRNIVLMGMGEPLHNYDAVVRALEIIRDARGLNIAARRITISTVGIVPGILRLAREQQPYNLAVSLHGVNDAERVRLVPAARHWPFAQLLDACRVYTDQTGRRIFFEWTLIAGLNDSPRHAEQLANAVAGINAHVNLIPLNQTNGFPGTPSALAAVNEFQRILRTAGLPATVRQRRGIDVAAGCGQLRAEKTV